MSEIARYIDQVNQNKRKALSVFLTAGYPQKKDFTSLALDILDHGADLLELGIPFSDPLADGPVIQKSSQVALAQGITLKDTLHYAGQIRKKSAKPLILMGYANPLLRYGLARFIQDALNSGVNGLIIPDVPLEEYDTFWDTELMGLDIILLTTPTSSPHRIRQIDSYSSGFVYCVSITGTTGVRSSFDASVLENLTMTYQNVTRNKMLIGFGISQPEDIRRFKPYCDGLIVGSAVIRTLDDAHPGDYSKAVNLVQSLGQACFF